METKATGQEEETGGEILAAFTKNSRGEEIRVRRFDFNASGRTLDMIDVRSWYPAAGGEMKPGKGLALQVKQLPDLLAALHEAQEKVSPKAEAA